MTERPILFIAPMVRAILSGQKTQTRRVVKWRGLAPGLNLGFSGLSVERSGSNFVLTSPTRTSHEYRSVPQPSPYGTPGDRLWVRETFRIGEDLGAAWEPWMSTGDRFVICDAEPSSETYCVPEGYEVPRNAREVHNSEGTDEHWRSFGAIPSIHMPRWASRITLNVTGVRIERLQDISEADATAEGTPNSLHLGGGRFATENFAHLWWSINGEGSWEANPWVWVVEFERVET